MLPHQDEARVCSSQCERPGFGVGVCAPTCCGVRPRPTSAQRAQPFKSSYLCLHVGICLTRCILSHAYTFSLSTCDVHTATFWLVCPRMSVSDPDPKPPFLTENHGLTMHPSVSLCKCQGEQILKWSKETNECGNPSHFGKPFLSHLNRISSPISTRHQWAEATKLVWAAQAQASLAAPFCMRAHALPQTHTFIHP